MRYSGLYRNNESLEKQKFKWYLTKSYDLKKNWRQIEQALWINRNLSNLRNFFYFASEHRQGPLTIKK